MDVKNGWSIAGAVILCLLLAMLLAVQARQNDQKTKEIAWLAAQLADYKVEADSLDIALRKARRELDAANAQLPCAVCPVARPKRERPSLVPVFERGRRFD